MYLTWSGYGWLIVWAHLLGSAHRVVQQRSYAWLQHIRSNITADNSLAFNQIICHFFNWNHIHLHLEELLQCDLPLHVYLFLISGVPKTYHSTWIDQTVINKNGHIRDSSGYVSKWPDYAGIIPTVAQPSCLAVEQDENRWIPQSCSAEVTTMCEKPISK